MLTPLRKPRITVLGSINLDLVIRCGELPASGETILAESSHEFCGGKGANQAVAAALAGGDVSMIAAVGSDAFAVRLIDNLQHHGVDCRHVMRVPAASGLAVIAVDQRGENSIMVVPGANAMITPANVWEAEELIASSDVLLVQLEIPLDAVLAGMAIARQHAVRVVLDPAPAPQQFAPELLDVDLLCPNESEATKLTGLPVTSIAQASVAAARLQELGAKHVAITLGSSGTFLRSDRDSMLIDSFPVDAVDTTAAGDAFAGAIAVRWTKDTVLEDAVRYANAAGALAASRLGAQPSMAKQVEIESLWKSKS